MSKTDNIQPIGRDGELLMFSEKIIADLDNYKKTLVEFTKFDKRIKKGEVTSKDVTIFFKEKEIQLSKLSNLFFKINSHDAEICFRISQTRGREEGNLLLNKGVIEKFREYQNDAYRIYTGIQKETLGIDRYAIQTYSSILEYALFYAEHLSGAAGKAKEFNAGLSDNINDAIG